MRNLILAFAMIFCISGPNLLFAAELPPLDGDFPAQWQKIKELPCEPKPGVKLLAEVYIQQANNEFVKVIALFSKNTARFAQFRMLLLGMDSVGSDMNILKNGEVFSFNDKTEPDPSKQIEELLLETTDLTRAEYASCGFPL